MIARKKTQPKGENMKITKNLVFWSLAAMIALALSLTGPVPQAAAQGAKPEFLFRCAGTMPLEHHMTRTLEYYAKRARGIMSWEHGLQPMRLFISMEY